MDGAEEREMGADSEPGAVPAIPRRRFLRWLLGFSVFSSLVMIGVGRAGSRGVSQPLPPAG